MGLYQNWQNSIEKAAPAAAQKILEEYYDKEKNAYIKILGEKKRELSGKASDLAAELGLTDDAFGAFVDGINTSLETAADVDNLESDSDVTLKILWNELYKNMHKAKADWLYNLPEWDGILTQEEKNALLKEYRQSCQAVSHKVGRNDPCPCGSGKKYKNCCME
ncbi:MAG: SEC-C metal-binding domain-containing protein [Clostridia bacterium]